MKARIRTLGAIVVLLAALVAGAGSTGAQSGAPTVVSYQGQVTVGGTPYTGTGYFKFAVVDQLGMTTYWSNDGTSSGGGEPTNAVSLVVSNGLFNVLLGDTSLANMTALPATAFDGTDRSLRVWCSTDGVKFDQLTPDRRVAAAPYALQAEEALQAALATEADTVDGHHAGDFASSSHSHDAAYVNEAQPGSVTSDMIVNGTIARGDIGQNGCTAGQVFQWSGSAWVCATITGVTDHGALTGLADDDHPQYFNLGQAEIVTGVPAFDGGTSGVSAPFSVDSSYLVAGLNADLLDGEDASAFALSGHTHEGTFWLQGGNSFGAMGTLGTNDDQALELEVNNVRALRLEPNATSPNLLGGYSGNWLTAGVHGATIGGGGSSSYLNQVTDNYGTVGGGLGNQAGNNQGTPLETEYATVAGGRSNTASGMSSSVAGGWQNTASGYYSSVGGGAGNTAGGQDATIGGGHGSTASGSYSTIAGGQQNTASGPWAAVGGGYLNTAGGYAAMVPGGLLNQAQGHYSLAAGQRAKANNAGCFVWADSTPADFVCSTDNQFAVRATGGVNFQTGSAAFQVNGSTVWNAGNDGVASGLDADLLDGEDASAFALSGHTHEGAFWLQGGNSFGTVGTLGTNDNQALELRVNNVRALRLEPDIYCPNLIGGDSGNWVTAGVHGATIGGGGYYIAHNRVTDHYGTVSGGDNNQAGEDSGSPSDQMNATVGGGHGNTASGTGATVPGGEDNLAQGDYSFAAGRQAKANSVGCFAWADGFGTDVPCNIANGWVARASGGVWFYTNAAMSSGVYVASGGGSWASISDRNLKGNVRAVDAGELLERVAALPISTWNYTSQGASIRHMGPMAQDFYAAFGIGEDDTHITTVDADGVALAAIQGLYAENQQLKAANESQQGRLDDLAARLARLERDGQPPTSAALPVPWFVFGILAAGGLGFGVLASAGLLIVLARRSLGTRQ